MEKFKISSKKDIHVELVSKLLHFRTQLHIKHWQTESYAEHKLLNKLYDSVLDMTDTLAETLQGKLGYRLKGYESYPYKDNDNTAMCIKEHLDYIMSYRNKLQKPEWNNIDNQLQVLQDTLEQSLYLLTLK